MTLLQDTLVRSPTQYLAEAVRTLMVHVEPGAETSPRLELAVGLARRLDATLIGVGAEMIPSLGVADPFGMLEAQWLVEMRRVVREDLKLAEARFKSEAAGLSAQWIAFEGIPTPTLARLSRSADLLIAGGGRSSDPDSYKCTDTAELVLTSGRPVLVAPPSGGTLHGHAVVVAWKDSRESRRALADAMPFLKAADDVLVLEVCEDGATQGDAQARTFAVVEHLKRHGVAACAKVMAADGASAVADTIQAAAQAIGGDLIVAGAYGHSRTAEWVFGGVTRNLLRAPQRFTLFSH